MSLSGLLGAATVDMRVLGMVKVLGCAGGSLRKSGCV